jgi:hypothetical protein
MLRHGQYREDRRRAREAVECADEERAVFVSVLRRAVGMRMDLGASRRARLLMTVPMGMGLHVVVGVKMQMGTVPGELDPDEDAEADHHDADRAIGEGRDRGRQCAADHEQGETRDEEHEAMAQ